MPGKENQLAWCPFCNCSPALPFEYQAGETERNCSFSVTRFISPSCLPQPGAPLKSHLGWAVILWWLEKKNFERKNKTKQGKGAKSRNWQGRKRKLASTARGHERQHETGFLERVREAEYTVPTSSFIWGQERTASGVRNSAEGTNPSAFVKAELPQVF